ncbi:4Fe-4S ferredoxin [Chloroflexota bacterium]
MAYKIIIENCTTGMTCADCEPVCPNQAINTSIDPARCTECVGVSTTPRCIEACPYSAIAKDPMYQETKEQLLKKWRKLHPGEEPAPGTY